MADDLERLRTEVAGHYAIAREIGRGGMATVYLAEDLKHHRHVALKVLDPSIANLVGVERFQREIEIAAHLQHPNIVPLFDSGGSGDCLYYVMPYVEGESLRDRLDRDRQLSLDEALSITREIAGALDHAHHHGVVHRDIKPANILLSEGHAMVADFGVARAVSVAGSPELTARGIAVGTPLYMSPEQAGGIAAVDGRADVYALGCVLYEMLAGEPPFGGATADAVLARHLREPPPSLAAAGPAVTAEVAQAIEGALAKAPTDRYPSAAALVGAIEQARTARLRGGRRLRVRVAGAAIVAGAIGIGAWAFWPRGPELDPRRVAAFPLATSQAGNGEVAVDPDAVTTALLVALDLSEFVMGEDAWRWLDSASREEPRSLRDRRVRAVARSAGAGYAVRGALVNGRDSTRLRLELLDVGADSVALTAYLAFAAPADAWEVGLRAAEVLLPAVIVGEAVDVAALQGRDKAATASFLRGEHAYRRSQFRLAFVHDSTAVARDSTFALAAMRGAQAASWLLAYDQAQRLIGLAVRHGGTLPRRYAEFGRGLAAYLAPEPDSAIPHFRAAIALEPRWGEAWMALGEVYSHYLPNAAPLDSLAEDAFTQAHRWDPGFAAPLYDLTRYAALRGDVRAARSLLRTFAASRPDSMELVPLQLLVRCVDGSLDDADWGGWAELHPQLVLESARLLTVGGLRQPRCAEAAWRAVLAADTTQIRRWGALQGLHAVLMAEGRFDDVRGLLEDSTLLRSRRARVGLYVLDVVGGAPLTELAAAAAESLRAAYRVNPRINPISLWLLGLWEARSGNADGASLIADSLAARGAAGDSAAASVATILRAHEALARGDTNLAMARFRALTPRARKDNLTWTAWTSFGPERLELARLQLASGAYRDAERTATVFESTGAINLVVMLPASLEIRAQAERAMGRDDVAEQLERRLAVLRRR